jgi:Protein of unknown function (DUF3313)
MKGLVTIAASLVLATLGGLSLSFQPAAADEPPREWDGLVRVPHKRLDHMYIRPGVDFSGYRRIELSPVEVAFDKQWEREQQRGARSLGKEDFERIRKTLAEEFRKIFVGELSEHGYQVVEEDAEDVLLVTAMIANLHITAPDTMSAGRVRTYVASAGRMTLVAELRDSMTRELLARAVDTEQARESGHFELATRVTNLGVARDIIKKWAVVLRTGLDDALARSDSK